MRGSLRVIAAACAWGTWSLFLRPTGLPPLWCGALVFGFVALCALPFFSRDRAPVWDRRAIVLLAAFAISDAINVGTFFAAMSITSIAIAVLTHSVAPILVALAAPIVESRRAGVAPLAALIALAGIALLLRPWEPDARRGEVLLGAALGAVSALAYAANVFLARELTPRLGPTRTMGLHAIGAALLLAPFAASEPAALELWHLGLLMIGAGLLGFAASVAFAIGLVEIGSARAAVLALLEPAVACTMGWLLWGEELGPLALLGGALVLLAAAMVAGFPATMRPCASLHRSD